MKPLVSIITPAYNCAKYIAETIESVLSQDYANIEYIVIDDGSTDSTKKIITGYEPWGVELHSHRNIGEQKTVNKALKMVKGKYFMIVNADDPLLPHAVSTLVQVMEATPVLCAYPDWNSINEDGSIRANIKSRDYDFEYMLKHHTCLPSVGSIFRSSIIKDIGYRDTSYRWLGDFDYWLRIGLASKMVHVPATLATWRHRDGQASKDKSDARAQEHIRIIKEFYSRWNVPLSILEVKNEAICWSYLVATAVTDSKKKAIYYTFKAFMAHPTIIFNLEFWDTVRRRAIHYLRR